MDDSRNVEARRLREIRINWVLVLSLGIQMSASYIMFFPTLHNFVVNPTNESCKNPGLGGSETEYSVVLGIYSGGGLIGSLFALFIARKFLSYRMLMIVLPSINLVANVLYGASINSWMVIIARFLTGFVADLTLSVFMWYYVSSSDEYNALCRNLSKVQNPRLKRKLAAIFSVITTCAYIPLTGLVALVAQFSQTDQFRWPAWFNVSLSILIVLLVVLFFKDGKMCTANYTFKFQSCKVNNSGIKWSTVNILSLILMTYVVYTGSVVDGSLAALETITSPILSDYFGFDVPKITFFAFGMTALFPLSCFCLLILERLKISSRIVLFIALLLNTSGMVTLSNWASFGPDVCRNFSIHHKEATKDECSTNDANMMCTEAVLDEKLVATCLNDSLVVYYLEQMSNTTSVMMKNENDGCFLCLDNAHSDSYEKCSAFHVYQSRLCLADTIDQGDQVSSMCILSNKSDNTLIIETNHSLGCNYTILNSFNVSGILELMAIVSSEQKQLCEAEEICYWNPQSIVTGEFCEDCPQLCRNKERSLNFIQVCIALVMITTSIEMTRYNALPMMSKFVSSDKKFIATSLYVLMGSISRLLTPFWFNGSYVSTERQTAVPCVVFIALQMPIFVGFLFSCSRTSGKHPDDQAKEDNTMPTILQATNPVFNIEEGENKKPVNEEN